MTNILRFRNWIKSLFCRRSLPMKIGNQGDWGILPNKQNRIRCTQMHCLPLLSRIRDKIGCLERFVISNKAINTAFHTTSVQKFSR